MGGEGLHELFEVPRYCMFAGLRNQPSKLVTLPSCIPIGRLYTFFIKVVHQIDNDRVTCIMLFICLSYCRFAVVRTQMTYWSDQRSALIAERGTLLKLPFTVQPVINFQQVQNFVSFVVCRNTMQLLNTYSSKHLRLQLQCHNNMACMGKKNVVA